MIKDLNIIYDYKKVNEKVKEKNKNVIEGLKKGVRKFLERRNIDENK